MKEVSKTYSNNNILITVNKEVGYPHISVHEYGEPCSGVLKHWGSPEKLIKELEEIIKEIKDLNLK